MLRRSLLTLTLVLAGNLSPVQAQDQSAIVAGTTATGGVVGRPYVMLGGGYALEEFSSEIAGTAASNGWGLQLRSGGRVFDSLAVEGHFEWMHSLETYSAFVNAKLFPLSFLMAEFRLLEPYVVLGVGGMLVNTNPPLEPSPGGFASRFGGGIESSFGDHFFLSAEVAYVLPIGRVDGFDSVSLSAAVGYRF